MARLLGGCFQIRLQSGGVLRLHSQRDCLALAWLGVARLRKCGGAVQELLGSESAFDGFLLAPVMVGMALEAAGLGGVEPRPMALPAILNARQKDVGGQLAGGGPRMTARAGHHAVGVVIEGGVHHPFHRNIWRGHFRQGSTLRKTECVALVAGLAPQNFLRFGNLLIHPLRRTEILRQR